jgi:hypothetical protein
MASVFSAILLTCVVAQAYADPGRINPDYPRPTDTSSVSYYQNPLFSNYYRNVVLKFPFVSLCNCYVSKYENQDVLRYLDDISTAYRQQDCSVYTWYLLIMNSSPRISYEKAFNVVKEVARVSRSEQEIYNLDDLPPYLDRWCDRVFPLSKDLDDRIYKRSPEPEPALTTQTDLDYSPTSSYSYDDSPFASYYNTQQFLESIFPTLRPESIDNIRSALRRYLPNLPETTLRQLLYQLITSIRGFLLYLQSLANRNGQYPPYHTLPVPYDTPIDPTGPYYDTPISAY